MRTLALAVLVLALTAIGASRLMADVPPAGSVCRAEATAVDNPALTDEEALAALTAYRDCAAQGIRRDCQLVRRGTELYAENCEASRP